MELQEWRNKFASRILQRGENYYYDGAVRAMKWDGKTIAATVSGTETYKVKIAVANGAVGEMSCTCPYADEDNCKHMAAVLFAASDDDFPGEDDEIKAPAMPIEEAVQSLSASDAKILLLRGAEKHSDIADWILAKVTGGVNNEQVRQWLKQISGLSREYSDRYGYIEYDNASGYADEMVTLINEKVPLLLDAGQPMDAFALTCKACEEVSRVDIDDSNGETGQVCEECAERWREILPRMSLAQRHKMFDWMEAHYNRLDAADSSIDDFLFGAESPFQEPEFLERKLEFLDGQIEKAGESGYRLESCVMRRLDVMRRLSASREETERFMEKHYNLPAVRRRLIEEALRDERFDDAIELLRQSKEMDAKYPGLVSEYSDKLIGIFQTLDRPKKLREELLYQMENVTQRDLGYVSLLKGMTPPEEWPELRDKLLSMPKLSWVSGELMEQEGLYRRLLDSVLQSGSLLTLDKFFKTLTREYPDETRKFYVACLRSGMERASNRNEYADCVKRLKKLEEIDGGKEAAAGLVAEWRTAYPRRRAMLDELKKRGF